MSEGWLTARRRLQSIARKREAHAERNELLIAATREAIQEARDQDLSMREIADLLGITRMQTYNILAHGSTSTRAVGSGRK